MEAWVAEGDLRVTVRVIGSAIVMPVVDVRGWTPPGALEVLACGEAEQCGAVAVSAEDEQGVRWAMAVAREGED